MVKGQGLLTAFFVCVQTELPNSACRFGQNFVVAGSRDPETQRHLSLGVNQSVMDHLSDLLYTFALFSYILNNCAVVDYFCPPPPRCNKDDDQDLEKADKKRLVLSTSQNRTTQSLMCADGR